MQDFAGADLKHALAPQFQLLGFALVSRMFGLFGGAAGGVFESRYRAMPVAFIDKQSAEFGDKVILPPSALDRLGACGGVERGLCESCGPCP